MSEPNWIPATASIVSALVGGVTGGGVVLIALRLWAESRLRVSTEKELGRFRHQLDASAAAASFDYERRLREWDLFIARKHRALARLHALTLDAVSKSVRVARDERDVPLVRDMNSIDVDEFLEQEAKFPAGKRAEVMARWDTDRDGAYGLVLDHLFTMQPEFALRAVIKANNFRLRVSLYLPDSLEHASGILLRDLRRMLNDYGKENPDKASLYQESRRLEREFATLRSAMRRESGRSEGLATIAASSDAT